MSSDRQYLEHIADAIAFIREIAGNRLDEIRTSRLLRDAVVRNLQTMAESTKRLSPEIRERHPEIPWRDIAGMRNLLVHDYVRIDPEIVIDVVREDLTALESTIVMELESGA